MTVLGHLNTAAEYAAAIDSFYAEGLGISAWIGDWFVFRNGSRYAAERLNVGVVVSAESSTELALLIEAFDLGRAAQERRH